MNNLRIVLILTIMLVPVSANLKAEQLNKKPQYQSVLDMQPVGYWPLDEGQGQTIHDRSVNRNHGSIRHVAWDSQQNLLDFLGRYQWLEIPKHKVYQTDAFSMGGWVFTRSNIIGSGWVNKEGMQLFGNRPRWAKTSGVQLCIRKQEVIDVVSGEKADVLGTRLYASYKDGQRVERAYGKPNLAIGQWHHLLYTFQNSTGSLYLNGKLIVSKNGIEYKPENADLLIGSDAAWWHQQQGKSGSLDGSVRNMVWFNRALSVQEVRKLSTVSRPRSQPWVCDETMVVLDGRGISLDDLQGLDPETLSRALQLYEKKTQRILKKLSTPLLAVLKDSLNISACRLLAVKILVKIDDDTSRMILKKARPELLRVVQAQSVPGSERAQALLALAVIKQDAADSVPALTAILNTILRQQGQRLPRVEDLLRNALIRALWDIAPNDVHVRKIIGRAFAEPLLKAADLSKPEFKAVRAQLAKGDSMAALEIFGKLPLANLGERFFTYKESGAEGDYTATARYKGYTYKVGQGIAWKGVEKIPVTEYKSIVTELSKRYPSVKNWRKPDFEHLYRVPVTKIAPDGTEQIIYLEGENFILDGHDVKVRAWSIFVDELGYVHLMGGQHNAPNPNYFIPGSWEKMGVSRDRTSDSYPMQMYWVSTRPECIDSFVFAGQRTNPQAVPASYMNYINLMQSPSNNTYLYGRVDGYGWQSWGMFRYDAHEKKWSSVGGDPYGVTESARRRDRQWFNYLHDNIRGAHPKSPGDNRCLVWAWQPAFYNFCRDAWGARFDKTGRLHVHMRISGLDQNGHNRHTSVYAWSDDNGKTFHRADGSPVSLPLTINPAPEHNAEISLHGSRQWWTLWTGLLKSAGYKIPRPSIFSIIP